MHDAHHVVPHRHDVQIGGAQRFAQRLERLIGKRDDVARTGGFHLALSCPPTDEDEDEARIVLKLDRRVDDRAQGTGQRMVAAVHHDELSFQSVSPSKFVGRARLRTDVVFVRPRLDDVHPVAHIELGQDPTLHEAVHDDDVICAPKHDPIHPVVSPRDEPALRRHTQCDRLIRIDVHHPVDEPRPLDPRQHDAGERCHGWRRTDENRVHATHQRAAHEYLGEKAQSTGEPGEDRALAE